MHHVDFKGYLGHLWLLTLLSLQLVLLLNGFVSLCLCKLMFSLGAYSNRFKYKALDLEHMEGVVLFDGHFIFVEVLKKLLH